MLTYRIQSEEGIVVVEPSGALSKDDFVQLAKAVDEYLAVHRSLKGLLIYTRTFPGWENFTGLIQHLKFVRNHHTEVGKVALVTDSKWASIAQGLASHFVAAEIRKFQFDAYGDALAWLKSP